MVNLSETLADMARAIVDDPESVTVAEKVTENGTVVLELSVAPDDMGKVIGRGGRIAKAIRQVMKVAANNCGKRVTVDICSTSPVISRFHIPQRAKHSQMSSQ